MIFQTPTKKGTFIANPCWKSTQLAKKHGNVVPKEDLSTISFSAAKPFGIRDNQPKKEIPFPRDPLLDTPIHLLIFAAIFHFSQGSQGRAFRSRCFLGPKSSQWLGEKGLYTQVNHFGRCNESVRNNPLKFERLFFAFWPEQEKTSVGACFINNSGVD